METWKLKKEDKTWREDDILDDKIGTGWKFKPEFRVNGICRKILEGGSIIEGKGVVVSWSKHGLSWIMVDKISYW